MLYFAFIFCSIVAVAVCDQSADSIALEDEKFLRPKMGYNPEDTIPVVEIRGEGKPMTGAQIRALEEELDGKPADIKIKHTWVPAKCPRKARRKDFVTFHYKGFLEEGKKFDQTYGRGPIRIPLGVGLAIPGLDKGLKGMCDQELRKIHVPWRMSRKKKSKTWKYLPSDEHWLVFDIEMLEVEAWTPELQFKEFDANEDGQTTATELQKYVEKIRKTYGKPIPNPDIDLVHMTRYFVEYFDRDGDSKVSAQEYAGIMKEDLDAMERVAKKPEGRKRDPGVAWILDFNGDGIMTREEIDDSPEVLAGGLAARQTYLRSDKNSSNTHKDEL